MAYKHNTVEYGFGQMGSVFNDTANPCKAPIGKVFVAITFLEDTVFNNSLAGLTPENSSNMFPGGTGMTSAGIDADGGDITGTEVFPKGITIYGRWSGFQLASGRVIAYLGV